MNQRLFTILRDLATLAGQDGYDQEAIDDLYSKIDELEAVESAKGASIVNELEPHWLIKAFLDGDDDPQGQIDYAEMELTAALDEMLTDKVIRNYILERQ